MTTATTLDKLIAMHDMASREDVYVSYEPLRGRKSMLCNCDGYNDIVIDCHAVSSEAEELRCLTHEMGHHLVGAIYDSDCPDWLRRKGERRAKRWAALRLIEKGDLLKALQSTECLCEAAEELSVDMSTLEDAMRAYGIWQD